MALVPSAAAVPAATTAEDEEGMKLAPAAVDARVLLEVGQRLGLDPIRDIDLTWVVQEYLNAPLPQDWVRESSADGTLHYVNRTLRYDVTTSPIEPRFKTLVSVIKQSRQDNTPLDEVTVLELIDPIERPADVKEMAEYQGIDIRKEAHLLWIAKLAVLETVPEGWEEFVDPGGRTLYRNLAQGFTTEEHPADNYFKTLLDRERAKRPPYLSIRRELYTSHVAHFRNDQDGKLRTAVDCFSGTWVPFYDLYGQRYWYDLASDRMTMDVEEVRREPAVRVMQRCWRGFMWRERLLRLHEASEAIGKGYRQYEYRKAYDGVKAERLRAVLCVQAAWRAYQTSVRASVVVFVRLAEEGAKCRRLARVKQRTAGLQACHKTFRHVRRKVVFIQRAWRQRLQRILERDLDKGPPYDHDSFIVQHSVKTIQNAFRDMQFANEYYAQKSQQEGVEVEPAR